MFEFMLFKFDEDEEDFYLCACSDWTTIVLAKNDFEAASSAVSNMVKGSGLDFNVSAVLMVKKIKEKFEISDSLVRMDQILSDIGMHKESRALKEIFEK